MWLELSLERSIELSEEHARVVCRNLTVFDGQYGLGLIRTTVNITSKFVFVEFFDNRATNIRTSLQTLLDFWLLHYSFLAPPYYPVKAAATVKDYEFLTEKNMDSQKHYPDQQSDTGIGLTPEKFHIKPSNIGDMPNTTPAEFLFKPTSLGDMPNTT